MAEPAWRSPQELRWWLPPGADAPVRELRGPLSYSEKKALSEFMERKRGEAVCPQIGRPGA